MDNKGKMYKCPIHDDKKPSMSWFEDGLMFKCHACNGKIDIYSYFMDYEHLSFKESVERVAGLLGENIYKEPIKPKVSKPNVETTELSDKAIKYMESRKINKDTLSALGVKERNWNGQQVYVFEYFNEKKELEFVSYRGIGKGAIKGGCESNTKPILWGMDSIDVTKPVVITEGQPDRMAVWQSGYKNVVSVPSGSNNFKWIENCWEWIQNVEEWIVFSDNDAPGKKMAQEIKNRLKNVKILIAERKDANEVLFYEGEETLFDLIQEKINEKPPGILDVADMEYRSFIDVQQDTIETGFAEYDRHVEDLKLGEITIVFGRNNEGKTTFMSQMMAHCISKGTKMFAFNGEMSERKFQDWLYRQIVGCDKKFYQTIETKYGDKQELKSSVVTSIKKWHKDTLYMYDNKKKVDNVIDSFFGSAEISVRKYGVKLVIVDNLMSILEEDANSIYSDQGNFIQRCKDFAKCNNVHFVIVCHPNKIKGEIQDEIGNLEKGDISGSGNISNKADNIIAVERVWKDERTCDAIITSLKDRETGQRKVIKMFFSTVTLRFYNDSTPREKEYGWKKFYDEDVPPWEQ